MNTPAPTQTPIPMEQAETGAVRSVIYPTGRGGFPIRLDLILLNDVALRRLGATYGEGQGKYGTFNWQKGFQESVYLSHALEHLLKYMAGDRSEDDLAHAVWNLMSLMWVQEKKPELLDIQNARPPEVATSQKQKPIAGLQRHNFEGATDSQCCRICGCHKDSYWHSDSESNA